MEGGARLVWGSKQFEKKEEENEEGVWGGGGGELSESSAASAPHKARSIPDLVVGAAHSGGFIVWGWVTAEVMWQP